jgi:hypothetical protein
MGRKPARRPLARNVMPIEVKSGQGIGGENYQIAAEVGVKQRIDHQVCIRAIREARRILSR